MMSPEGARAVSGAGSGPEQGARPGLGRRPRREEPPTLVALQTEIKQLILDRRLGPGDALPTESDLVEMLGVGRNSVREALKSLQALDLVDIRHGYGTYVGSMSLEPLADGLTFRIHHGLRDGLRGLRELLEIREELEAALIRKVTPLLGDEELDRLSTILDEFEAARRVGEGDVRLDQAFHQMLYQPLGNQLVLQLLDTFWIVYQRLIDELRGRGLAQPDNLVDEHRAIVDALRSRDPLAAEQAVRGHFTEIYGRMARTFTPPPQATGP